MCDINIFEFLDNSAFLDPQPLLRSFLNTSLYDTINISAFKVRKGGFQLHSFALCKYGVLHIK